MGKKITIENNTNTKQTGDNKKTKPPTKVITCLNHTFPSEEERRDFFTGILREKLKDPDFRAIEGFPIAEDEDILALSDPPYYTACPNPWISDFVAEWESEKPESENPELYHREPFAADVSEGKNDPIYNAHSYHTKVPHKAIMRYILHYTEPGDIVFDGFCGTGMTGVAAQMCGDRVVVESLGYQVENDGTILQKEMSEETAKEVWVPFSKLGARRAVLNDLSPAATFIAYNYNTPVDVGEFEREAKRILAEVEEECGWMYATLHKPSEDLLQRWTDAAKNRSVDELKHLISGSDEDREALSGSTETGRINYTVWSDVFVCPECAEELVFWEEAVDKEAGKVRDEFPCPHCSALLTKRKMNRAWVTKFDDAIGETIRQAKQVPVLINYSVAKKRHEKVPDSFDVALIEMIESLEIPYWYPRDKIIVGKEIGRLKKLNITNIHQMLPFRTNIIISKYLSKIDESRLKLVITSTLLNLSWMYRWRVNAKGGTTSGTYYICSTPQENNAFKQFQ